MMKQSAFILGLTVVVAGCGQKDIEENKGPDAMTPLPEAIPTNGPKSLSADVTGVWQKAGFLSGWMGTTESKPKPFFAQSVQMLDAESAVPAFSPQSQFDFSAESVWETLPSPGAAFGLSFVNPSFGDAHAKQVSQFEHLAMLNLEASSVTDAGLKELAQLKNLKRLVLTRTDVSDGGVEELKKALPNCAIIR